MKMNCDMYGLIKKLPPEFKLILDYVKTLDYYQLPNYKVRVILDIVTSLQKTGDQLDFCGI